MHTVEEFLAYAIKLEQEAAIRFDQLADAMESWGNREVGKLFRRLGNFSRLHLAQASARSGFREMPTMKPGDFNWPGLESPETAAIWAADPFIGREQALEIALDAEVCWPRILQLDPSRYRRSGNHRSRQRICRRGEWPRCRTSKVDRRT